MRAIRAIVGQKSLFSLRVSITPFTELGAEVKKISIGDTISANAHAMIGIENKERTGREGIA
jgi:hypothetical protein